MSYLVVLLGCCIALVAAVSDVVIYDISTQDSCREETHGRTKECRWPAGLYMADHIILNQSIIAYKIRWFSGRWSGWYVPGVNDIDEKFNPNRKPCTIPYKEKTLRRRWSNFYDHTHKYIICKPNLS